LTAESLAVIETSFKEVAQKMDCKVEEFNGETDHIHVLIEYPPKLSISQLVNSFKVFLAVDTVKLVSKNLTGKRLYGVLVISPLQLVVPQLKS